MRTARLKPTHMPVFHHLYNRVVGDAGWFPFKKREKEMFIRLLHDLDRYYVVQLVDYQVMSNHFHLEAFVPKDAPDPHEVCRRYNAYYQGRKLPLEPSDPRCAKIGEEMRDISCYMRDLQQRFTTWFNRTRPTRRRGTLWAGRFKNVVLGDARAVWNCLKYIDLNPVRAGMVDDPADYRFCTYGAWRVSGRHPLAKNVREALLPWLEWYNGIRTLEDLSSALAGAFGEITGVLYEGEPDPKQFLVGVNCRVRCWVDGIVIGSKAFINEMTTRYGGILRPRKDGFTRARGPDDHSVPLYCYKQLRTI